MKGLISRIFRDAKEWLTTEVRVSGKWMPHPTRYYFKTRHMCRWKAILQHFCRGSLALLFVGSVSTGLCLSIVEYPEIGLVIVLVIGVAGLIGMLGVD